MATKNLQLGPLVTDLRVVSVGERGDKIVRVGHAGCLLDLFLGRVGISVADVLCDRCGKQRRFLADITNQAPEMTDVDILDVDTIELDRSFQWIIEAFEHLHDSRLATTTAKEKGEVSRE